MKIASILLSTVTGLLLSVSSPWARAGSVDQLHEFLKSTRTFRAEFTQTVTAKHGRRPAQSAGMVSVSRPGKLRWEILRPYPQLMLGDGEKFWVHDPELQQVTVRRAGQAISGSPAALLAGSNELEKNFALQDIGESAGLAWVEAIPKSGESGFERVRLGLAGAELRAMTLIDHFGQTTEIRLSHIERNPALPANVFRFMPPPGTDVVGE